MKESSTTCRGKHRDRARAVAVDAATTLERAVRRVQ